MPPTVLGSIGRLLVPPACACCAVPLPGSEVVCRRCRSLLVALPPARCAACGAPLGHDAPSCPECRGRRFAFAGAWAAFAYNGACRRLVAALKLRGMVAVARFMGAELGNRAPARILSGAAALVPVPVHPRRRLRHGFNPAGLVAEQVSRVTGVPVLDPLRRCGRAPSQAQLGRVERLRMAEGSIRVPAGPLPTGRLVVVDDVHTTGATANACSAALAAAGATEVVALAFARTERSGGGRR
jgi:ComF family protein